MSANQKKYVTVEAHTQPNLAEDSVKTRTQSASAENAVEVNMQPASAEDPIEARTQPGSAEDSLTDFAAAAAAADIVITHQLSSLVETSAGSVLVVGYGNRAKGAVKACAQAGCSDIWATGTEDKRRGFSFSGMANVVMLGKKFDRRLFSNTYAILMAARECGVKTLLVVDEAAAQDELLSVLAYQEGLKLYTPLAGDKTFQLWVQIVPSAELLEAYEGYEVEWAKCPVCKLTHDKHQVLADYGTCPTCHGLYRLTSDERIAQTFDEGTFEEWNTGIPQTDPLGFPGFEELIETTQAKSGLEEAVRCGKALLVGMPVALCVMEATFMMGSMGTVVGEKITRTVERATAERLPLIIFSASGGARMQEGLVSLMQMAKISAAVERHGEAGLPYISVITDPTTGGVTASFAMLGDVIVSEPHALIGFAGRRVIQDTIKQTLPDDFQTAEFALEHGLIDAIVERKNLKAYLAQMVALHMASAEPIEKDNVEQDATNDTTEEDPTATNSTDPATKDATEEDPAANYATTADAANKESASLKASAYGYAALKQALQDASLQYASGQGEAHEKQHRGLFDFLANNVQGGIKAASKFFPWIDQESAPGTITHALNKRGIADAPGVKPLKQKDMAKTAQTPEANLAWESVLLARNVHRPTAQYYINFMVDGFLELHGDRAFADDEAILAGVGWIAGQPVTILAEEKGADLQQRIKRNFGCPQPEGYRKSLRLMKQAEKFNRPIVCLVDTQGAFCGMEAEERGQGNAIAENLAAMSALTVPVVCVVLGEGGSGGALALAVGNRVAMQEHAVYSILSPEGFASILWKDRSRAAEAAAVMKMSAAEAHELGLIEAVLPEGDEGQAAHETPEIAARNVEDFVVESLKELQPLTKEELKADRYQRFRAF